MKKFAKILILCLILNSCKEKQVSYTSYSDYPEPINANLWLDYSKKATEFKIWSPTTESVKLNLYKEGFNGKPFETYEMKVDSEGIWSIKLEGDLNGTYYTYQVKINDSWLEETPGIYAQAVGVNGKRAMVLDLDSTNPDNWENHTHKNG